MATHDYSLQQPASAFSRWLSKRRFRHLDRVGEGAYLMGRPYLVNRGRVIVGANFHLSSRPVQSHIVAMPGAKIDIEDGVSISYGAAITATRAIKISRGAKIGPFVVIMDSDFHSPGDRHAAGDVGPVHIGAGVIIGARVTILRSSDIGDGAPHHERKHGLRYGTVRRNRGRVPARPVSDRASDDTPDLTELIKNVLGLAERPNLDDGPHSIPQWDSLGTLRLLLAHRGNLPYYSARRTDSLGANGSRTVQRARTCDFRGIIGGRYRD